MAVTVAEVTELFWQTAHRLRRRSMTDLAPLGVTPAQFRALRTVAKADGPVRMGEIAARLDIAPRSATSLVDGLEQAGLIARAADPDNRRSVLVVLTPAGVELTAQLAQARKSAGQQAFGKLTAAERATLFSLLSKAIPPDADRSEAN